MEVPQEQVDPQQATVEAILVEEMDHKKEGVEAAMVVVTHLVETHQGPLDLKDPNDLNNQWAWIPN